MATLRDLMAATPGSVRRRASRLRAFWRVKGEDRYDNHLDAPYRLYILRCKPPRSNKTQQIFSQWVRVYGQTGPGSPSALSQRIWARCSCEYFKFNLEVALAMVGSSTVKYSNGMIPVHTNPMMRRFLCKHLWRLAVQVARMEKTKLRRSQGQRRRRRSERSAGLTPTEMLTELR